MHRLIIVAVIPFLLTGTSQAQLGSITLTTSPSGHCSGCPSDFTQCCLSAPKFSFVTFYIQARPYPPTLSAGIQGAEFRVTGAPASAILFMSTANPGANVVVGDPIASMDQNPGVQGGANIAFPQCQPLDSNGFVLLFTVQVMNLGLTQNVTLDVTRKDPPSNHNFSFPLMNGCDDPVYTVHEVHGGRLTLIPTAPLAVEEKTWSATKQVYR